MWRGSVFPDPEHAPRDGDTYKEYRRLNIEFTEVETAGSTDMLPYAVRSSA